MKRFFVLSILNSLILILILFLISCSSDPSPSTPDNKSNNQGMKVTAIPKGERIIFLKKFPKKVLIITDSIDVGMGDIWSMNPQGGDQVKHTNLSESFNYTDVPEISYDGRSLIFISNYKPWVSAFYMDVFQWDFATNKVSRISGDERPSPPTRWAKLKVLTTDTEPVRISAKGSQNYVFPSTVNSDSGSYGRSYLMVPAGENIWVKAEYSREKSDLQFTVVPEAGGGEIVLSTLNKSGMSAEYGHLSPDNQHIISIIDGKLAMYLTNSTLVWDKNIGGNVFGYSGFPVYSHDGRKVVLCWGDNGGVMNTLAILSPPEKETQPNIILPQGLLNPQQLLIEPCWSPDDSFIIFGGGIIGGTGNTMNIFKIPAGGGQPEQLTNYSGNFAAVKPAISPDGTKIAFTLVEVKTTFMKDFLDFMNPENIKAANIYVMPVSGGTPTQITTDGASYNPTWGIVK